MVSLDEFADIAAGYARTLDANSDQLIRNTVVSIVQNLATSTPIDQGTAVSNWQVGVGSVPDDVRTAFVIGSHGSTASENMLQVIDEARRKMKNYKYGTSLDIVNNVPYLARLNDGWSAQAPAGFVEEAFLRGIEQVKNAPDLLTKLLEGL